MNWHSMHVHYHEGCFDDLTLIRTAPWFPHDRLLLNHTYLHLTRLGVRPVERFMLGHLAANGIEDLYQVSALEEIR